MFTVDAHLDLAMNGVLWNRDLTLSAHETRAIETGSFVLAPAQGGFHEDGRGTYGHSLAVSPWGEVIGQLDHDEPGVLLAELDLPAVAKAREWTVSYTARKFLVECMTREGHHSAPDNKTQVKKGGPT